MPDPTFTSTTSTAQTVDVATTASAEWSSSSRPFRVGEFNRLVRGEAIELVKPCLEVERWWTEVVDARPYANHERVLLVARGAADPLTRRELDLALAGYLGVRADDWLPTDTTHGSGQESATVVREEIAENGRAYLARFGRPFVIRTPGRSTAEVAAHLRRRLGHDLDAEDRATGAALRQIGLLALVRRIGS